MAVVVACRHHWRIAPPAGPTSVGVCLKCGAEGVFQNSKDDYGPNERSVMDRAIATAVRQAEGCRE
jgi:hypothetical protein